LGSTWEARERRYRAGWSDVDRGEISDLRWSAGCAGGQRLANTRRLKPRRIRRWIGGSVMKSFFLLLVIALASVADPADLRAEAGGGRTEAGGAFMSSYRPWPSAVTSGPAAQPVAARPSPRTRPRRR
jgi:hypothetical protein